jgi:uncharacterized oligopeptide transporter (OPT) family protein
MSEARNAQEEPESAPREDALAAEDPERKWLREVYQPDARQLTVRAVITGMIIGGVMCLSNLYVVLKTGWSLAVTMTACILAFGLFQLLSRIGLVKGAFTTLENNAMSSVASAAGYMTGGGNMAAIPALFMLTGSLPSTPALILWISVIATLGVFAAIPLKRQLINLEQLSFPTGVATAETIRSLHTIGAERHASTDGAHGEAASSKAAWLGLSALVGAAVAVLRDLKAAFLPLLPKELPLGGLSWGGHAAAKWSVGFDCSLLLVGAGGIMGLRTCASMLAGMVFNYVLLAPWLVGKGIVTGVEYKLIVKATLWPAAAMMLAHGLTSFAFQWRSIGKSFSGLGRLFQRGAPKSVDPLERVECPGWWAPAGYVLLGPIIVVLMAVLFRVPWWAGLLALPLSFVMGIVAARVTGETDVTPTKALGPMTQLAYGSALPGDLAANVMGANVTGGVGLHAADLLTDLKSGYLLGANPRQQFFAQLFGVAAGAVAVMPAFRLLVPDPSVLGSPEFPAPGVQVWAGVSKALVVGIDSLPVELRWLCAAAGAFGLVCAIVEKTVPKRVAPYIPSAAGIGVAMTLPGSNSIAMFVGAAIAWLVARRSRALADRAVIPVSSGLIAGESLTGIVIKALAVLGATAK